MALKIKHKVQERLQELTDMKLVATLGNTKSELLHTYIFGSELYKERVSFMAVAKKYAIAEQNITILGTAQTQEYIQRAFPNNHFNMVVVDDTDIDELFNKSVEHIGKNTILDLTQGFRHFPMTLLLGAIFDISKEKNIHEIYYAKTKNPNDNPSTHECSYDFISLFKYIDISNISRIINTFVKTLVVTDYEIKDDEFRELKKELSKLSKKMLSNDYASANRIASEIFAKIGTIQTKELIELHKPIQTLKKEIREILFIKNEKESVTLFRFALYMFDKDLLLQSLTLLFEALGAYLDENIYFQKCDDTSRDIYSKRNCLKKEFLYNGAKKITNAQEFQKNFKKIDILRNKAAHAFTSDKHAGDMKEDMQQYFLFFQNYFK
ncbi:MAG: hypothetical protein QG565_1882 [Campylobacterota bacterium]|nr:hypothetical protein [Campylobacterota bacterium]MDQ1337944.1 hypothetical protein [Campylobacterota bacterium]